MDPTVINCLTNFGADFGPKLDPQSGTKTGPKMEPELELHLERRDGAGKINSSQPVAVAAGANAVSEIKKGIRRYEWLLKPFRALSRSLEAP